MARATVAVTGATGYLGRPLLRQLLARPGVRVRALTRGSASDAALTGAEVVRGDVRSADSMGTLLEPGCDVVNLAYLWNGSHDDNLAAVSALVDACNEMGVRRLVHLSTVAVFGRVPGDRVDESSPCRPVISYGRTKLETEALLAERCRVPFAVVRPTTVFGTGGPPLERIAGDLRSRRFVAYLRSVLFGSRRMNLVHADNVAAAIVFLLDVEPFPARQAFIVSQDEDPANNFREIELRLMQALDLPDHKWPRPRVPDGLLTALLGLRRHNNVNPRRVFDGSRLRSLGYRPRVQFTQGLADWCTTTARRSCTS